jgi:hypothetical protein
LVRGELRGCQMVYFQTKNPNLGKFWRVLVRKMLLYFMAICNIICPFGIFYDHLVHIVFIWYIFPVLVPCTKKSLATLVSLGKVRRQNYDDEVDSTICYCSQKNPLGGKSSGKGEWAPGLPDGIFSNQKSQFDKFWRALEWKRLVHSMDIRNILRPFDTCYGHLVI